ncbi:Invasion gene expression up-regulator, SirB [Shewanella denitrificans OS217]|jgi:uncharacterized membrane protein SirB2|uniref:Invasion gene expression up-regulator, SirB n=1 Tax=Shewanella denitrificans (strain OS217 / ATCC BAA-1090 / DSM 15013) TaxID=318161 RepID=Q12QR6_SHEDO|nr:SirB2 family protein [Shewanella denitrificans]ABE54210.1 Invasion gene expression up-regulator, SirB [Shewanella denitrificans OS217]
METVYFAVKHLHLTLVATSVIFFIVRFVLQLRQSSIMDKKFVKVAPHVIDTFLLLSGLALCFIIQQFPFVDPWLTEKIIAVGAYILLGYMALRTDRNKLFKVFAFIGALGWVVFAAKMAVFKQVALIG